MTTFKTLQIHNLEKVLFFLVSNSAETICSKLNNGEAFYLTYRPKSLIPSFEMHIKLWYAFQKIESNSLSL